MTTPEPNHDPLDDLLQQARWPKPTNSERARVEAHWDRLAIQRARIRRAIFRWSLVAGTLLMVGVGAWILSRPTEIALVENPTIKPVPREEKPIEQDIIIGEESRGQDPTPYEKAAFTMIAQQQSSRKPLAQRFSWKRVRANVETELLRQMPRWELSRQLGGLELLKHIGSPRAIPVLEQLSRDPNFKRHAWPVALELAPPKLLVSWAIRFPAEERRQALHMLLHHPDQKSSLPLFLNLVAQPKTRTSALAVVKASSHPPTEQLLQCLAAGTKQQRYAAGLVLGRISTPEMAEQLVALAKTHAYPSHVMLALLNSRERAAVQFVSAAQRNPFAQNALHLAYLEWEHISFQATVPQLSEIH